MKYILIIPIAFFIYVISFTIDDLTGDNFYKKYVVPSECNYVLPPQYSLVKDSISGEYAIRYMNLNTFEHYISVSRYITLENFISEMGYSDEAITFKDSCKAKGLAKMFFSKNGNNKKFIAP